MAGIKLGLLGAVVSILVGGVIVAWIKGWDYMVGIGAVAILMAGLFASVFIALLVPIGNMMVKGILMMAVFALIVLWGFTAIGVM